MDPHWVPSAFWFACIRIHFRVPDCMCYARGVRGPIWVPNNLCDARRRLFVWLGCSWALLGPESPLCRCLCVCLRSSWAHFGPRTPQARPICVYALAMLYCACVYAGIFMWCMRVCMCVYACMHVAYAWCMCVCVYACCVCGCSVVLLDPESPVHVCMHVVCLWVPGGPSWTPGHPLCAGLSKPPI